MVDKELIAEIKNSVNIVEAIGEVVFWPRLTVLFRALSFSWWKDSPSFNVVEDKQFHLQFDVLGRCL